MSSETVVGAERSAVAPPLIQMLRSSKLDPDPIAAQEPRLPGRVKAIPHRLAMPMQVALFEGVLPLRQVLLHARYAGVQTACI